MASLLPRSLLGVVLSLSLSSAYSAEGTPSQAVSSSDSSALVAVDLAPLDQRTEGLLSRQELKDYRGWLKYLRYVAHDVAQRKGATSEAAQHAAARWSEWLAKIETNPGVLGTLRGVQEWAYESAVDGSGQPFKLVIPDDYDASKPAPLSLYLHGATGNHLDHSSGFHAHNGFFDLAVLGRSRIGGYTNLSEADVFAVLDYVRAHWSLDPERWHLSGGSMGGMGTYRLGSRYPHLWASGAVTCGAGEFVPAANLLTLPLYAVHSVDDPVVPVLQSRSVMQRLRERGGQIILDETNGLGHASWDYKEGQARASTWAFEQRRPDSHALRSLDFTALDGVATRSWWAEITEWGDSQTPARVVAHAGTDNTVYLSLTNAKAVTLRLSEAPVDSSRPVRISIDAGVPLVVPVPVPQEITLVREAGAWTTSASRPTAPMRLHTPGGPSLLYNGEPLLIVYGTSGDAPRRAALQLAAQTAARSPNPVWQETLLTGDAKDADGITQTENLYGSLAIKADVEVTADDVGRCHLVLIGSATENSVVAKMAAQLPVSLTKDSVDFNDGDRLTGQHLALGLVHYNPLAPQHLIFWVAAHDVEGYAPGAIVPLTMTGRANTFFGVHFGADVLVSRTGEKATDIVASRGFTSRWQWAGKRSESPLLPQGVQTYGGFYAKLADAVRAAVHADIGLVALTDRPSAQPFRDGAARDVPLFATGEARLSDAEALFPFHAIGVFEISGAQLQAALKQAEEKKPVFAKAGINVAALDPSKNYTVAMPTETIWWWNGLTKVVPPTYRQTSVSVAEALETWR